MSAADARRAVAVALVDACAASGTTHVFGVPGGGSNLDVVGAAVERGLAFVLTHTETAAAVMAGVAGELTGAPGVCVATRGPGAASAVNGVAQALLDRQPMVVVTDCVSVAERARVSHQRLDQRAMFATVAKASVVLGTDPAPVAVAAVATALEGRPGPVHVDVDVAAPSSGPHAPTTAPPVAPEPGPASVLPDHVADLFASARRAVLVVGGGAVVHGPEVRRAVGAALDRIGARTHTPMLCTYKARGVVPDSASWCGGVATGATIESPVLHDADLIVGIGLDPVEYIPAAWPYAAPVVLLGTWAVDDATFFGASLAAEVVGDLPSLVTAADAVLRSTWEAGTGARAARQARDELLAAVPDAPVALTPQQVVAHAAAAAPAGTVATVDAGAHMLVAMPLWPAEEPGTLLISSGLATMGFSLPAAIAAALVRPDRRVVCFTGDGGLGMVLAELETVARLHLPITVVVFNDALLSLIAAKQQPVGHGGDLAVRYRDVDFAAVARACGMHGERITDAAAYERALAAAFAGDGPVLLDVAVDPSAYGRVLDAVRGPRPR